MIQIKVLATKDPQRRVQELCEALRSARIWKMSDRRCTKNLKLIHASGTVRGEIRRVNSDSVGELEFECTAKDAAQAAITAGRFVNLVLRDLESVSDIHIHRRSAGHRPAR